ncbi:MAG: hypothetical protein AAGU19_18995 [Prolixibacteraceae bacterium]
MLKKRIKKLLPDEIRYRIVEFRYNHFPEGIIRDWEKQGCPIPPHPVVKQKIIREYQRKYGCKMLVETGTYLGYMVSAQKRNFKKIYSIELADRLYERAARKFRKYSHIRIIHGDSGEKIGEVIKELDEPAIFWLDGHYSGGFTAKGSSNCPIWKELDAVFSKKLDHVILIDDAREFTGKNDYPTYEEVKSYILTKNPKYKVSVEHDIIRAEL